MDVKVYQEKYTSISPYTEDTEKIRIFAAITKLQICDFVKILVEDWVEKHPEFKNIPVKEDKK